jgi:mRNA-degrading endonuclease RelE of RelBE toxin-antitoxin system
VSPEKYRLIITPTARRRLAEVLPEAVAFAVNEFLVGDLLTNPRRVGKQLGPSMEGHHASRRGTYRVVYRIDDRANTVTVIAVAHRRDAYRPPRS